MATNKSFTPQVINTINTIHHHLVVTERCGPVSFIGNGSLNQPWLGQTEVSSWVKLLILFKTDMKKKMSTELLNRPFFPVKNIYFVLKDVDHSVINPTEQALNEPLEINIKTWIRGTEISCVSCFRTRFPFKNQLILFHLLTIDFTRNVKRFSGRSMKMAYELIFCIVRITPLPVPEMPSNQCNEKIPGYLKSITMFPLHVMNVSLQTVRMFVLCLSVKSFRTSGQRCYILPKTLFFLYKQDIMTCITLLARQVTFDQLLDYKHFEL